MKRRLKTRFDLLYHNSESHVVKKQEAQTRRFKGNKGKVAQKFESDHVYFENHSKTGPSKAPGIVEECTGSISCKFLVPIEIFVHRHF